MSREEIQAVIDRAPFDKLVEPFPASQIQKLPQGAGLDYVSHGNVTKRLLEVDPVWNWRPMALDADGLPLFDEHGGLWIYLTVLGVTRIGYGEPQGRDKYDMRKGAIGNAIRVAAMRFGVALDLWAKELPDGPPYPITTNAVGEVDNGKRVTSATSRYTAAKASEKQLKLISDLLGEESVTVVTGWKASKGIDRPLTSAEASELITYIKDQGYTGKAKRDYLAPADPWADIPRGGADES